MQSIEVKPSGERVLVELRVFDGVDKADRTLIEEMSLTRAIGFRGELDDAILQVQDVRTQKVLERQKKLREEIAALQQELVELAPPGAMVPGVPVVEVTLRSDPPVSNSRPPRQKALQPSDEIIY